MKAAPAFWWQPTAGWPARLLSPAAALYGAVAAWHLRQAGSAVDIPVLCVGNFVVGGAGKTPTVLALVAALRAHGYHPAIVSRGYGSRAATEATPRQVDAARDDASAVGDEPLLLARAAPTFVGCDRSASARAASAAGADIVVLDDGFQNPHLAKTASLIVVDGAVGFGNRHIIPAGPLRAPLAAQWRRASALLVIGDGEPGAAAAREAEQHRCRVFRAKLVPEPSLAQRLAGQPVVAFAGLGRPAKFRTTLEELGAHVVGWHAFPDHQPLSEATFDNLGREAHAKQARLVTTEKDWVRLPSLWRERSALDALPVTLVWDDADAVAAWLALRVSGQSPSG